ncbi:MAG: hypothetical protein H7X93_02680 [Sphingomonadaceae bacterium]|nr:hypothetical protein [Sphingomonadaceae bacterium]
MTGFEFVFSLFALLLGLSVAEVLGGFARAVQKRRKIRIGWLAPLLGLVVVLDVSSYWLVAWAIRDVIPIDYFPMMCGIVICGLYYLVASLVFPHDLDEWPELDAYYFEHKWQVVYGVLGCNALALGAVMTLGLNPLASLHSQIAVALFLASAIALVRVADKRWNIALLVFMALQYPVSSALRMVGA